MHENALKLVGPPCQLYRIDAVRVRIGGGVHFFLQKADVFLHVVSLHLDVEGILACADGPGSPAPLLAGSAAARLVLLPQSLAVVPLKVAHVILSDTRRRVKLDFTRNGAVARPGGRALPREGHLASRHPAFIGRVVPVQTYPVTTRRHLLGHRPPHHERRLGPHLCLYEFDARNRERRIRLNRPSLRRLSRRPSCSYLPPLSSLPPLHRHPFMTHVTRWPC